MIQIDALPAFNDNYIWLLQDTTSHRCAVIDPGDVKPVQAWLGAHPDWVLSTILVTHHHHDHVGGVAALKAQTGAKVFGPINENIPDCDQVLEDGDQVEVLGLAFEVLHVPGHTLGHIAYYHAAATPLLFCGDTLFAAGCGRLFEGTPTQMYQSLLRLAALPGNTQVYCTHEYTLSNLRFALEVEPNNLALQTRFQEATQLREQNLITLPSEISLELLTNPFLRVSKISVKKKTDEQNSQENRTPEKVFATLRAWKDRF